MSFWRFWLWLVIFNSFGLAVMALNISYTVPTQCDALTVSWIGGQPPFRLMVISVSNAEFSFDIPENAFNATRGSWSFTFPLTVAQGEKMIIAVSDATGIAVGETTPLLTVGASKGGTCNTQPAQSFEFGILRGMQQCANFTVSVYEGAVQPVYLYGLVLGSQSYIRAPPINSSSYTVPHLDFPADTKIVLTMIDSLGRSGGSSGILSVQPSNDSSCLGSSLPLSSTLSTLGSSSSTTLLAFSTTTPVQFQSSPTPSPTSTLSGSTSTPIISGATQASHTKMIAFSIAGGVIALMVATLAIITFIQRRAHHQPRVHRHGRQRGQKIESIHPRISESSGDDHAHFQDLLTRPYTLPSTSSESRSLRSASLHRNYQSLQMKTRWNASDETVLSLPFPPVRYTDRLTQLRALVREPTRRFRAMTRTSQRSRSSRAPTYVEVPPTPDIPPPYAAATSQPSLP